MKSKLSLALVAAAVVCCLAPPALAAGTVTLEQGTITVTSKITIHGQGMELSVIDGNSSYRPLKVNVGSTLTLYDLRIANGYVAGYGGGTQTRGRLIAENVRWYNNKVVDSPTHRVAIPIDPSTHHPLSSAPILPIVP
jgi:hypothetical protein